MIVDHIRLSQKARDQLISLKRKTGVKQWNVLCRWALCVSLAESSRPADAKVPADSSVEMSWRVFGGAYSGVYEALIRERCKKDGVPLTHDEIAKQFRLHLHRGISYLAVDRKLRGIAHLVGKATETAPA